MCVIFWCCVFIYLKKSKKGVNSDLDVYAWEESLNDTARRLVAEETMKRNGRWTVTYEGGQMLKRYNESAPKVTTNPDEMMSIAFSAAARTGLAPAVAARGDAGVGVGGGRGGPLRSNTSKGSFVSQNEARDNYDQLPLGKMPWFSKCDDRPVTTRPHTPPPTFLVDSFLLIF